MKPKVVLGMSGGVDSSVAAVLLKQKGLDVIGITMQLVPKETERQTACCNLSSINDAKRVASQLNIPHYTLNIREEFKENVMDYFVDSYLNGITPNPCVECNRHIKFDHLKKKADELGADFVATGHYCRITTNNKKTRYFFKKAKDKVKDQSYFLYMLTANQLKHTLFPLGGYTKPEIRQIAQEHGLLTAKKAESQEICFVTQKNYKDYINEVVDTSTIPGGDILNTQGQVIGRHDGLYRYTIGQRKGLPIQSPTPLYVLSINAHKNTITVGDKDDLQAQVIHVHTFSTVNEDDIIGQTFDIKIRYQMTPIVGTVVARDGDKATVRLKTVQSQITPGQSMVLYTKDFVIGGGIIGSSTR